MKGEELRFLASRIRQELDEIQRILARVKEGWARATRSNDEYYLDGVALNLHSFYSGMERISRKPSMAEYPVGKTGTKCYCSR